MSLERAALRLYAPKGIHGLDYNNLAKDEVVGFRERSMKAKSLDSAQRDAVIQRSAAAAQGSAEGAHRFSKVVSSKVDEPPPQSPKTRRVLSIGRSKTR